MLLRPGQHAAGVAAVLLAVATVMGAAGVARAQPRNLRLRYFFQPDCYRPSLTAPCDSRKTGDRLDLGPQIAVWVESADRSKFVDTLLVTNATALRGIGNRPGHWSLPSSPKFPYGKRIMALPVWAHTRGKAYDAVVMQDGPDREFWLGFHESVSSPDPYYCRPMSAVEIDVDAISCPTAVFNSAKGRISKTDPRVYYPPRNDLRTFTDRDCDQPGSGASCAISARQYADLNDLDAVAAATPAYGRPFEGTWTVPADLPEGDYALAVEVGKEFDNNAAHNHPAYTDQALSDSGLKNNFGQPSVVYRVPFRLGATPGFKGAASDIAGYGDWNGATGVLHPPDATITTAPGSGRGRLLSFSAPGGMGMGRVHLSLEGSGGPPRDAGPAPPPPPAEDAGMDTAPPADGPAGGCAAQTAARITDLVVPSDDIAAEHAIVRFVEPAGAAHDGVERYVVRVWEGTDSTPAAFASGTPADPPAPQGPGAGLSVRIADLKGQRQYTVGVQPLGHCLDGEISYARFATAERKFTKLSGCFIATAAYGSPQATGVAALRRARDAARRASPMASAAVAVYERSSPPLADLLRGTEVGRVLVRRALAPLIEAADALSPRR